MHLQYSVSHSFHLKKRSGTSYTLPEFKMFLLTIRNFSLISRGVSSQHINKTFQIKARVSLLNSVQLQHFAFHPSQKSCSRSKWNHISSTVKDFHISTTTGVRLCTGSHTCTNAGKPRERLPARLLPWPCSARRSAAGRTGRPAPCRSACWPE